MGEQPSDGHWTDEGRKKYAAHLLDAGDQDLAQYIQFWLENKKRRTEVYRSLRKYHGFMREYGGEDLPENKTLLAEEKGNLRRDLRSYADWQEFEINKLPHRSKKVIKEAAAICPGIDSQIKSAESRRRFIRLCADSPEQPEMQRRFFGLGGWKEWPREYTQHIELLRELVKENGETWVRADFEGHLPAVWNTEIGGVNGLNVFDNGFPNYIYFSQEEWLKYGHLAADMPGVAVNIYDVDDVRAVTHSPAMAQVHRLTLSKKTRNSFDEPPLSAQDAAAIAESPYLGNLEHLWFSRWAISDESRPILVQASSNPKNALYGMEWKHNHENKGEWGERKPETIEQNQHLNLGNPPAYTEAIQVRKSHDTNLKGFPS